MSTLDPLNYIFPPKYVTSIFLSSVLVVCPGTQNGLSSTGSQEHQYNLIKDRYDGCEIIMGNLEITQIESNWDFSFLKVNTCHPHSLSFHQLQSKVVKIKLLFPVVSHQLSSYAF